MKSTTRREVRKRSKADTFPLFLRSDGRWCKKIGGRHVYFGYDKDQAIERYNRHVGLVAAGLDPDGDDIGLREMFNRYLGHQELARDAGEIGARSVSDSANTLRRVIAMLGDRIVASLSADDFGKLKVKLAKGRSPVTLAGDVRRTKAAFNWAYREGLLRSLPRFGDFRAPPKRVAKLARAQRAVMTFEPDELRVLIDVADPQLRAMIYLGLNAALLPVDIARLQHVDFSTEHEWLAQPRFKTGEQRRAWLWPETRAAIQAAQAARPKPMKPVYDDLVFLTEAGHPVVRTRQPKKAEDDPRAVLSATVINRVTADFRVLCKTHGFYRPRRGFSQLRHLFLTVAESGLDFVAVSKVMGHAVPGVTSHYRQHVGDDRIKEACAVVRQWLIR